MERSHPEIAKTIGKGDQGSRAKAGNAAERTKEMQSALDSDSWPRGASGQPMMKITMTASELIPTGQYANVSVGPAQITAFVDSDRLLEDGDAYFSEQQRATIAQALNELAEIVEGDVLAVQRNLVLEAMQDQVSSS